MIALLTIVIAIFMLINFIAIMFWIFEYEWRVPDILVKASTRFLITEGILILVGGVILISYGISRAIVRDSTNNDYKGCTVLKESDNND